MRTDHCSVYVCGGGVSIQVSPRQRPPFEETP